MRKVNNFGGIPTDEDGFIRPDFMGEGVLLIPPKAETEIKVLKDESFIYYPIPSDWDIPISSYDINIILTSELQRMGWKLTTLKPGKEILEDFVYLTSDEAIIRFVLQYGPLWRCVNVQHEDCIWNPYKANPDPCMWIPIESISEFRLKIRQFNKMIEIYDLLRFDRAVPSDLWEEIGHGYIHRLSKEHAEDFKSFGWDEAKETLMWQKFYFSTYVNSHLSGISPWIFPPMWKEKPQLRIRTGRNFMSLLWMELATSITGDRLYFCSSCSDLISTAGRKKPRSAIVYCDGCGKKDNWRESKRRWAEERRAKKKSVQSEE